MRAEVMFWMLMAVVTAFSIAVPRFRKVGLSFVGIAILTVVAVIAITQHFHPDGASPVRTAELPNSSRRVDLDQLEWDRLDQADPAAKDRIPLDQVRFDQIRVRVGTQPQTIEAVMARLYNDSPRFTLTHYAYYLVVQDCVTTTCTTVYDQRGLAALEIPPSQARDVTLGVRDANGTQTPPFHLLGVPKILLSVTRTRAAAAP